MAEKIFDLRKKNGMSQEALADKLNVSRQSVSRWEMGSALPDAENILQLSKLFSVSADFLLNDDLEEEKINKAERKIYKAIMLIIAVIGAVGNAVIYIISRFVRVVAPIIIYENAKKIYHFNYGIKSINYRCFIKTYKLELLIVIFTIMLIGGLIFFFVPRGQLKETVRKVKSFTRRKP